MLFRQRKKESLKQTTFIYVERNHKQKFKQKKMKTTKTQSEMFVHNPATRSETVKEVIDILREKESLREQNEINKNLSKTI